MVTAQARWAKKKKKQGRCSRCGQPRNRYSQLCDKHQRAHTAYVKAWRKKQKEAKSDNQGTC